MAILNVSRFRKTPLVRTRAGNDTFGIMEGFEQITNIKQENYDRMIVESGFEGRTDLIAASKYGDPHLEWVIIMANSVKNPFNWPVAGESIKIPRLSFVRGVL